MRKIIYQCDKCKREYPYELRAGENDRAILVRRFEWEFCRICDKGVREAIKKYVIQGRDSGTMGAGGNGENACDEHSEACRKDVPVKN